MRTTVDLDADLYALAQSVAASEDCSLSAAVNRLLRRRVAPPIAFGKTGLPISKGARPVTQAEITRFLDEEP
jgi:hypothetical protein